MKKYKITTRATKPNPNPQRSNANNFTLAFILSCGEFRYFIGGDLGGSGGTYIDQETTYPKINNESRGIYTRTSR
jgi:hypothetical protein